VDGSKALDFWASAYGVPDDVAEPPASPPIDPSSFVAATPQIAKAIDGVKKTRVAKPSREHVIYAIAIAVFALLVLAVWKLPTLEVGGEHGHG
jgi:hypothetical protein